MNTRAKTVFRLGMAGILAVALLALGIRAANATPNPPYYMKYADNHSWCIADPGDSQTDGTFAIMEHCVAGNADQEIWFSQYIGGGQWWKITNDVGMCLFNPNGGRAGQLLRWYHCDDTLWSIWGYYQDVAGHYIWADAQSNPQIMIYVVDHNPFQGQNIEGVAKQLNPRVIGAEMCVTNGADQPLIC